jgi:hypothetical protein
MGAIKHQRFSNGIETWSHPQGHCLVEFWDQRAIPDRNRQFYIPANFYSWSELHSLYEAIEIALKAGFSRDV